MKAVIAVVGNEWVCYDFSDAGCCVLDFMIRRCYEQYSTVVVAISVSVGTPIRGSHMALFEHTFGERDVKTNARATQTGPGVRTCRCWLCIKKAKCDMYAYV